ncbi:MAG: hypothetical protein HKN71_01240, partial [Gemmatimonadetes bacterium]|nr:hypothetical protein [Gemmatimonadota bacterium]
VNWAWNYIFYERSVRLILPAEKDRLAPVGPAGTSDAGTSDDGPDSADVVVDAVDVAAGGAIPAHGDETPHP